MMLTDLRSWWQNYYVGDFLNVKNRLPKSQIGQTLKHVNCSHQKLSPTQIVSNICHHYNVTHLKHNDYP